MAQFVQGMCGSAFARFLCSRESPEGLFTPRLPALCVVLAATCVGQRALHLYRLERMQFSRGGVFQRALEFTGDGLGAGLQETPFRQ